MFTFHGIPDAISLFFLSKIVKAAVASASRSATCSGLQPIVVQQLLLPGLHQFVNDFIKTLRIDCYQRTQITLCYDIIYKIITLESHNVV